MMADELRSTEKSELEISKDTLLENLVLYIVSAFCAGTEMRFRTQLERSKDFSEAERWQGKAVYMACTFMPENCPIVDHMVETYLKNFTGPNSLISKNTSPKKVQLQVPVAPSRPKTPKSP